MTVSNTPVIVPFVFPSAEIAKQFMLWMDGAGEQWHWQHAGNRDEPKLHFDYDYKNLKVTTTEVEDDNDNDE